MVPFAEVVLHEVLAILRENSISWKWFANIWSEHLIFSRSKIRMYIFSYLEKDKKRCQIPSKVMIKIMYKIARKIAAGMHP
jgi:hypothetical protein